jgi:hypothetical protein
LFLTCFAARVKEKAGLGAGKTVAEGAGNSGSQVHWPSAESAT